MDCKPGIKIVHIDVFKIVSTKQEAMQSQSSHIPTRQTEFVTLYNIVGYTCNLLTSE